MKKDGISEEQNSRILECFMQSLIKNGLKSTTMDSIASSLQMSKRTLYELYGNKDDMFKEVLDYHHLKTAEKLRQIFSDSQNVMEAIIKCFLYNRDLMNSMNANFIKDMQEYAKGTQISSTKRIEHHKNLYEVLLQGVKEGYFRQDINLMVQCRMFILQMESLKRAEELFPEDISLIEVYDNIIIGFLRGISTLKGLEEFEKYMPSFSILSTNIDN